MNSWNRCVVKGQGRSRAAREKAGLVGGLVGRGEVGGDQVSGTIGIGFQGSSVGKRWMPEWVKSDRATRVIRVAIYAKVGRPLFVLFYQIWGVNGISGFPCVIAFRISFPPDQELESFVSPEVAMCLDGLHLVFFFSADKVRWWSGEVGAVCRSFAIGR